MELVKETFETRISSQSVVSPKAKIGVDTVVQPFCVIEDDVVIGDNCTIGPNAVIYNGARIGNNVKVFPGAVIAAVPQDLKYRGEKTMASIGDNTTIRECVTINRGTEAAGETKIGSNVLLMAYTHVAHDCIVEDMCIIANAVQLAGHVEVGHGSVIGGMSAVIQFARIGRNAMVQGNSSIAKDIPPYVTVANSPVRFVGINRIGLQRNNFSLEEIEFINRIYKSFYNTKVSIPTAIKEIRETYKDFSVKEEIVNFLSAKSRQGVLRRRIEK